MNLTHEHENKQEALFKYLHDVSYVCTIVIS